MSLQNIASQIAAKIEAKAASNPDPTKIMAVDLAAILNEFLTEVQKLGGTRNNSFEIQLNSQNQDVDGDTLIVLRGGQGGGTDSAIRNHWDAAEGTTVLQFCNDYTGTGSDVWEVFNQKARPTVFDVGGNITLDPEQFGAIVKAYSNSDFTITLPSLTSNPTQTEGTSFTIIQGRAGKFTLEGEVDTVLWNASNQYQSSGVGSVAEVFSTHDPTDGKTTWSINWLGGGSGIVYKTGTVVDFIARETEFGTEAAPETGNITAAHGGAVVGHMAFMIHNSGVEPTFGSEFHKIAGSGDYELGVKNYIYFDYRSATRINYSITQ